MLMGRAKTVYSVKDKCFHNLNSALVYRIMLFMIGCILWPDVLRRFILPSFGVLGYISHLLVEGAINISSSSLWNRFIYWMNVKRGRIIRYELKEEL